MMSDEAYRDYVWDIEQKLWPYDKKGDPRNTLEEEMELREYWVRCEDLFIPRNHFRLLMNQIIVEDLKNGKTMLSVGGPGYLEKLLVKGLGVDKNNITLADSESNRMSKDFEFYLFDSTKEWPDLKKQFDYIIFPENFVTSSIKKEYSRMRSESQTKNLDSLLVAENNACEQVYVHIFSNAINWLKPHGQVRYTFVSESDTGVDQAIKTLRKNHTALIFKHIGYMFCAERTN